MCIYIFHVLEWVLCIWRYLSFSQISFHYSKDGSPFRGLVLIPSISKTPLQSPTKVEISRFLHFPLNILLSEKKDLGNVFDIVSSRAEIWKIGYTNGILLSFSVVIMRWPHVASPGPAMFVSIFTYCSCKECTKMTCEDGKW